MKNVPTALEEPGYRSIHRGIRVVTLLAAAVLLGVGTWAWLLARPASPMTAVPLPLTSAAPAVDVESSDAPLPTPTPFPKVFRPSALSRAVGAKFPLTAATPRVAHVRAVAQANPDAPATVPRVMTGPEIAASTRMNLEAPQTPPVSETNAEPPPAMAETSTTFVGQREAPHASFFAQRTSDVGYEPEDAPCIVRATSAILARLVTHVDSELPGGVVRAQIITPVNCADGDEAVPAGAILQGTYDSATVAGESRLLVVFTRIIFPPTESHPNGRAYAIATQTGTDALGGTGLSGQVNTHSGRVFGQAVLYTLLGAAGAALGNATSGNSVVIGGAGTSVTSQFAPAAQTIKPTIYANAGDPVDVVLARDLPMEPLR